MSCRGGTRSSQTALLFGDAVARNLLTDYRVIVLAVNEEAVDGAFQRQLADSESGLKLEAANDSLFLCASGQ